MSDITMLGPISKEMRQRIKLFIVETGVGSYEQGFAYLLSLYEQLKSK